MANMTARMAAPMTAAASFADLDRMHQDLDDLFLAHQEQIIAGDFARAAELLDRFGERLLLHMRQEEEELLPLFAQRQPPRETTGTPPASVYLAEHRKIRELLGKIRHEFRSLLRPQPPPLHVVAMIERQSLLKRVIEHHRERECCELYARLEELTTPAERAACVARCLDEWDRVPATAAVAS